MRLLARLLLLYPCSSTTANRAGRPALLFAARVLLIALLLLVVPVVSGAGTGNHTPTSDMPTLAAEASPSGSGQPQATTISHFVYVLSNGQMQVFDMDNGHQLVKSVSLSGISGGINSILG